MDVAKARSNGLLGKIVDAGGLVGVVRDSDAARYCMRAGEARRARSVASIGAAGPVRRLISVTVPRRPIAREPCGGLTRPLTASHRIPCAPLPS